MAYSMSNYTTKGSRDPEFDDAVWKITHTLFPQGFDVLPAGKAPNTWQAVKDYYQATGKLAVSDADDKENVFGDMSTFHAFRAWHDWTHIFTGGQFTLLGEATVARAQEATLACMFGTEKARQWTDLVHAEIITANFDGNPYAIDESHLTIA